MVVNRRSVLIFGASLGGRRLYQVLGYDEKTLAFLDNDASKHQQVIKGHKILSPTEGLLLDYDVIIIASQAYSQIALQLLNLGVPRGKIEVADAAILRGEYELTVSKLACFLLLSGVGIAVLASLVTWWVL